MKTVLLNTILLIVGMSLLTSCGGDKFPKEKLTKAWKFQQLIAMQEDGETIDKQDFSDQNFVWKFKDDGTFDVFVNDEKVNSGTWEMEEEVQQSEGTYKYKMVKLTLDDETKNMRLRTLTETELTFTEQVDGMDWKQFPSYDFIAK